MLEGKSFKNNLKEFNFKTKINFSKHTKKKKITIHLPIKVKHEKHTHTIIKNFHHHHKPIIIKEEKIIKQEAPKEPVKIIQEVEHEHYHHHYKHDHQEEHHHRGEISEPHDFDGGQYE